MQARTVRRIWFWGAIVYLGGFLAWFVGSEIAHRQKMKKLRVNGDAEIATFQIKNANELREARAKVEDEARTKRWAFGECLSHGGVPVMSFGPAITCVLSPLFDSWLVGIDDPPGVMRHLDGVLFRFFPHPEDPLGKSCVLSPTEPWAPLKGNPCVFERTEE